MPPSLQTLSNEDLRQVQSLQRELYGGHALNQVQLDALVTHWEPKVRPEEKETAETYAIVVPDGGETGVYGPRWIFHLLGLRHRAVEVALLTPSGLIALQRRAHDKENGPNALDVTVAGHIPQNADGTSPTYEEGAWKEIAEEIGLHREDASRTLVEGRLMLVGFPYISVDIVPDRNPPFLDVELRQIFAATLTGEGLAALQFTDQEVSELVLVEPLRAWELLARPDIASGMRYSLPRVLDWLDQCGSA